MVKKMISWKKAEEPGFNKAELNLYKKISKSLISKICLFVILLSFQFSAINAVCTPQSATLCAAVDDIAQIYLNGTLLDTFTYCDVGWACQPKCIYFTPAQLALLLPTGNILATYVQNTSCCELWGSWSLDIGCSDGTTAISSSNDAGLEMLSDTSCTSPNPSPTPNGGVPSVVPAALRNERRVDPAGGHDRT